ncbi:MAG TPA: rhodanese-like domain-containing protein [Usitatibacter sp.]|nr:rhodanese-like domain-containing protein [Usitatibacter sp.]
MNPETPEAIFDRAAERARQMGLPYAGAVTPAEAHRLQEARAAKIVDVRTPPEYSQVGHVPGTPLVVWPRDGDDASLASFVQEIQAHASAEQPVLLLCRSGARSHNAAHLLTHNGFTRAYNILEGFEGAPNSGKGWLAAGLPSERG